MAPVFLSRRSGPVLLALAAHVSIAGDAHDAHDAHTAPEPPNDGDVQRWICMRVLPIERATSNLQGDVGRKVDQSGVRLQLATSVAKEAVLAPLSSDKSTRPPNQASNPITKRPPLALLGVPAVEVHGVLPVLARIADDEGAHAALAFRVVAWAVNVVDDRRALTERLERVLEDAIESLEDAPLPVAEAHDQEIAHLGRLSAADQLRAARRVLAQLVRPLLGSLPDLGSGAARAPPRLRLPGGASLFEAALRVERRAARGGLLRRQLRHAVLRAVRGVRRVVAIVSAACVGVGCGTLLSVEPDSPFVGLSEHMPREAELVDQRADTPLMRPEPSGTEVERGPNGRSVCTAPLTREDPTTEAIARLRQHDARPALPEHVRGMQSAQPPPTISTSVSIETISLP